MLRLGMTALAAALALTSTPLFAQAVDPAPAETSPPVIAAPPAAVSAPAEATAPAAALNIPKISVDMSDAPTTSASEPAETVASPVPKARAERTEQSAATETPVAPVKKTPAPAPQSTMTEAPSPESVLPTPPVAVETLAPPAAATQTPQPQTRADMTDEALPIAGGVLAALALAGGALAFAGRKRRYREEYRANETAPAAMAVEPEPLTLNTPINPQGTRHAAPAPAAKTAGTALPAGFDLSRYGRHVQAAYRGPTADNPSLLLRTRLKRARFYDQRERMGSTVAKPQGAPQARPAAQPARQPEFVTSRRFNIGTGNFRPAYQG